MKRYRLFVAFSALLSACSGPSGPALRVAINSGVEGDGLKAAAKRWEARTGVRVVVSEFPYNSLYSKMLLSLSGGASPFDIVMLDDPWFPKLASSGLLEELGPYYARSGRRGPDADFVPTSIALGRHPYGTGALYALPLVGNCQLLFYRKDLLAKHGLKPPRTWAELLGHSRRLMRGESGLFGYVIRGEKGNPIVVESMPIFWAFGAALFRGERPTIDTAEAVRALEFLVELKSVSPRGVENFNADQVASHLLQEKAAMAVSWPAWIPTMEDPAQSKVAGRMGYSPVPGGPVIGNWLLGVPAASANKEAAFAFADWVTGAEEQRRNALETGNPPTRVSVFRDPELLKKYPHYPVQLEALRRSKPRPRTARWMEIENTYGVYLSQALSGVLSPEAALAQAQEAVLRIVR